jgi:fermentation-respiration switch protein FrsA (DUF1100 family)
MLSNGEKVDSVPQQLKILFRESVQNYLISWFKYDPKKEISKLNCPVLIVQGTNDIQVETKEAVALNDNAQNSSLLIINGMNHILKDCSDNYVENLKTYYNPDLKINKELINKSVEFLRN